MVWKKFVVSECLFHLQLISKFMKTVTLFVFGFKSRSWRRFPFTLLCHFTIKFEVSTKTFLMFLPITSQTFLTSFQFIRSNEVSHCNRKFTALLSMYWKSFTTLMLTALSVFAILKTISLARIDKYSKRSL